MRILLYGANGRLGSEISSLAVELKTPCLEIARASVAESGFLENLLSEPSVICDVTRPEGTVTLATLLASLPEAAQKNVVGLVIGTTGHSDIHLENLRCLIAKMAICLVPNFARGIYLFEQILQAQTPMGLSVAELARRLGFEVGGWEIHHRHKADAPSGTAKSLAKAAGLPANSFSSVRTGSVVGEHTVLFSGDAEDLRISHSAHTRRLFAAGAIDLCRRLNSQRPAPGWYTRDDLLQGE